MASLWKSFFGQDDGEKEQETETESEKEKEKEKEEDEEVIPYSPSRVLSVKSYKHYTIPNNDLYKFLLGAWKRNLEWREFGNTFSHLRTSNVSVLIESHQKIENEVGARYLKWSFGRTLSRNDLSVGYIMKCTTQNKSQELDLEWQYSGVLCHGKFFSSVNLAILNFNVKSTSITVSYRIMDHDVIAVNIVEVDDQKIPTIQYGNMYRLDSTLYQSSLYN